MDGNLMCLEKGVPCIAPFPRATIPVLQYQSGTMDRVVRSIVCEDELHITVNGEPLETLLCSHANLRELALGFLITEGVISSLGDVRTFLLDVDERQAVFELHAPLPREACRIAASGFGGNAMRSAYVVQGRAGCIDNNGGPAIGPTGAFPVYTLDDVWSAMQCMQRNAREYSETRGMHCSALFRNGALIGCFEDIGRHNTFDKLAGHCMLADIPMQATLLTTTGRISGEMMRKALRLGVTAIASCSGPTDMAVRLAYEADVLLIGYAGSDDTATVYAPGQVFASPHFARNAV